MQVSLNQPKHLNTLLSYIMMTKNITLSDEAFWKLKEVQVNLRCMTWDELAHKIYEMVFGESDEENEQSQAQTH